MFRGMALDESRYQTLLEVGRGGMGVVELAQDRDSVATLVAIKRMLPELAKDVHCRSAFLREARLLAKINHPNVVKIIDIREQGEPSLIMEYIDGVSLRELLTNRDQKIEPAIASKIIHYVALGLHAAHELKNDAEQSLEVVHRDVSPHNILVTVDGQVKLLDFGVAKTTEGTRTATGEVKGKLGYMAPEQAMADTIDRRSDIYSLGAVLYELLSGQRMHGEGTDLEILRRIATEKPKPLNQIVSTIDPSLQSLVEQMTAESIDARPDNALVVAQMIEPYCATDSQFVEWASTHVGPKSIRQQRTKTIEVMREKTRTQTPTKESVRKPNSNKMLTLVLVLAAFLMAMGVLFLTNLGHSSSSTTPEPSRSAPFSSASLAEPSSVSPVVPLATTAVLSSASASTAGASAALSSSSRVSLLPSVPSIKKDPSPKSSNPIVSNPNPTNAPPLIHNPL